MFFKYIYYPVTTLGPGNRVGIWVTGCDKNCPGCMSPELRDREAGRDVPIKTLAGMITSIGQPIDGFTITGGEPFLQAEQLLELISMVRREFSDDIILYTGYTLDELQGMDCRFVGAILQDISVLIHGPYIEAMNDGIGIRGSSNQSITIFRPSNDYSNLSFSDRKLQSVRYEDRTIMIGIQ